MPLVEIPYPDIGPIAFHVFGYPIRWYGISYVVAFVLAQLILRRLSREKIFPASEAAVGDLIFAAVIGTVLGGRLGYILVYKFSEYVSNPMEILKIWHGGLSFHGGLAGVAIAITIFAKKRRVSVLRVMDACSIAATPGILCVRLANFVNCELWGRPTDVPWAMVFPEADGQTRHPSQLYEGALEGALLFLVLWSLRKRAFFARPGGIAAAFLLGYAILRFLAEFTREPDENLGTVLGPLTMGQLLCLLMAGFGIAALVASTRQNRAEVRGLS